MWNWDQNTLKGKYFVAVMGEEEYLASDGTIKVSVKIREPRSKEAWQKGEIKIPELKKLKIDTKPINQNPFDTSNFNNITDEDLPF